MSGTGARNEQSALLLDLRGIEPSGSRLIEVVRRSLESYPGRLVIDWGDTFPWGLDDRIRPRRAFPDEVVDAVSRLCEGRGLTMALGSALPTCYEGRPEYRHLLRAISDESAPWRAAAVKLVADLIADARSLMPALDAVELRPGAEGAALVSRAAADVGILVHGESGLAQDSQAHSLEERLLRMGHPAAASSTIADAHDELRAWRTRAWAHVCELHETVHERATGRVTCAEPARAARRSLGRHLRGASRIHRRLRLAYATLADAEAVDAFVTRITDPVREQYGALGARASVGQSAARGSCA